MADQIDPRRANIAMGLAVSRWRKVPDDSIAASLDNPQEWVQEAALMNRFLPAHLTPVGFSFIVVTPNEFSVGITKVRQYAGLIYKHMVPVAQIAEVVELAAGRSFDDAAKRHAGMDRNALTAMAGQFFTTTSPLRSFGGE